MLNCVDVCEPLLLAPVVLPSTVTVDLLAEIPIRAPITKLPFWMQEMSDKEVVVGVVGIVVDCADEVILNMLTQMAVRKVIFLNIVFTI